ncbi:hypothetical protein Tco_0911632 [Tanacetum coccineum]|uniref:Uncharacterized protein n=1 Tax=Tanacetum coccineum TaxID=301880 RepID=A0ABQ5CXZ3_9ASTR
MGEKRQKSCIPVVEAKLCSASILDLPEGQLAYFVEGDEICGRRWLKCLSDTTTYKIRYSSRKGEHGDDALSRKGKMQAIRVRALVMTIGLNLPKQILSAQSEARKGRELHQRYLCACYS